MRQLRCLGILVCFAAAWASPAHATVSVTPTTSYDGQYTVAWTETASGDIRLYLRESVNGGAWSKTRVSGASSQAYSGKANGNYAYKISRYMYDSEFGIERFLGDSNVATVTVTTLSAPGVPGAVSVPLNSTTGSYTVSWGAAAGTVDRYDLYENGSKISSTPALSVTITGHGNGTYAYKVQACNAAGCGPFTAQAATVVLLVPGTPSLTAPGTTGPDYTISWTANGATYQLDESSDQANWSTTTQASSSKTFTGMPIGTKYYRVRSCNASGCSANSNVGTATVTSYLSGPTQSSGTYTLTWTARTQWEVELQERLVAGTFSLVYTGTASSRTFTRSADGVWEHRLRYCFINPEPGNPRVCDPYGAVFAIDVQVPPSVPGPITATLNTTTGGHTLNWGASSGSNVGYWLETLDGSGSWVNAGTNPKTTTSYTVPSATDGVRQYRVKACNRYCSAYNAPASVTILKIPTAPQNLIATNTSGTGIVALAWSASLETVDRYVITETGTLQDGTPRTRTFTSSVTSAQIDVGADGAFTYAVAAENGTGRGPASSSQSVSVLRLPAAPEPISAPATNVSGTYAITWTAPAGYVVDGYRLERRVENGPWTPSISARW